MLLLLLSLVVVVDASLETVPRQYGLMIDAGSSGSRIHVYTWAQMDEDDVPVIVEAAPALKLTPGLSSMLGDTAAARAQVQSLCNHAATHFNASYHNNTRIYLKATAGLRSTYVSNASATRTLLNAVRDELELCPFMFMREDAEIMSGEHEGIFAWIATNLLARDHDDYDGIATLELGGASMQATFYPEESPLSNGVTIQIGGDASTLYSHSYLGYGQDWAWAQYKRVLKDVGNPASDACSWTGRVETFEGTNYTGNYSAVDCANTIRQGLLGLDTFCGAAPCAINGVHMPVIPSDQDIYAVSAFYYSANTWGCGVNSTAGCVLAGARAACQNLTWEQANNDTELGSEFGLELKCFAAHYIDAVFETFGFNDTTPINYALEIDGTSFSWTLGAMTYEAGYLPRLMEIKNSSCPDVPPMVAPPVPVYGLMVDAGSSGSRIHVFHWSSRSDPRQMPNMTEVVNHKVTPGLSALVGSNQSVVDTYISGLCSAVFAAVPLEVRSTTRMFLRATAGLRLTYISDPVRTGQLLEHVRDAMESQCPFEFETASILPGEDEGAFGWIATNFLLGRLQSGYPHPVPAPMTAAAFDLGGASTQVTFIPDENALSGSGYPIVAGRQYSVYTHSFLQYGQDEAFRRLSAKLIEGRNSNETVLDPCYWTGYTRVHKGINITGAYNATACDHIFGHVTRGRYLCNAPPCAMDGVHMPAIPAAMDIYAFSAFFYVADTAGCAGSSTAGCPRAWAETTCGSLDWAGAEADTAIGGEFLLELKCVAAHYVHALFQAYNIAPTRAVEYVGNIGGTDAGWALGAMLATTSEGAVATPAQVPQCPVPTPPPAPAPAPAPSPGPASTTTAAASTTAATTTATTTSTNSGSVVITLNSSGAFNETAFVAALATASGVAPTGFTVTTAVVDGQTVVTVAFIGGTASALAAQLKSDLENDSGHIQGFTAAAVTTPPAGTTTGSTTGTSSGTTAQSVATSTTGSSGLSGGGVAAIVIVVVVVLCLLAGGAYFYFSQRQPSQIPDKDIEEDGEDDDEEEEEEEEEESDENESDDEEESSA